LLDEQTFEEQWSLSLSALHFIAFLLGFAAIVASIVILAFIYTPIKNLIPGYTDEKWRKDANISRRQVDSLLQVSQDQYRYIQDIQTLLSGGFVRDTTSGQLSQNQDGELPEYVMSIEDSALRARIAEEDRYNLSFIPGQKNPNSSNKLYLFSPLNGSISSRYDSKIGHFGVDIVAPMNSIIKAVQEGTVVIASWTSDGGNTLQIQHPGNLISVYKHNSVLLKKSGDKVEPGDAIAIIGDSGEHSDGPHLHFELWRNGAPVNPEEFLVFTEP
jgi:lipoprotein NlpD